MLRRLSRSLVLALLLVGALLLLWRVTRTSGGPALPPINPGSWGQGAVTTVGIGPGGATAPGVAVPTQAITTTASAAGVPVATAGPAAAPPGKEHGAIPEADPLLEPAGPNGKPVVAGGTANRREAFLREFVGHLPGLSPKIAPLDSVEPGIGQLFDDMNNDKVPVTEENMAKLLKVSTADLAAMRDLHKQVVDLIPKELPADVWKPGQGIVLTGGGVYFPILLGTIKWLTDRNEGMPIEVFMAEEEYEPEYCESLLPSYGATCVVIERVYGFELVQQFEYMGYPLKLLAMLASSFEEVYFMDVDSLPLVPLKEIFSTAPYTETGYVLFPDYWFRTTVPQFYDVAGIKLKKPSWWSAKDETKPLLLNQMDGAISEYRSTESGQIFVNKTGHFRSLLLALYYNLNGFSYYFPLLNIEKGLPGFGDKDSFVAAAHVMGEKLYQVQRGPKVLGYWGKNDNGEDNFNGYATLQHDPRADYARHLKGETAEQINDNSQQPLLTLHATMLKMTPARLFDVDHRATGKLATWIVAEKMRYLGKLEDVERTVSPTKAGDIEYEMFDAVRFTVCDWMVEKGAVPKSMASFSKDELKQMCKRATEHVQFLKANPNVL